MKFGLQLQGLEQLSRELVRKGEAVEKSMAETARKATDLVAAAAARRIKIPTQVSRQDASRSMKLSRSSPLRTQVLPQEAKGVVLLGAYWTPARSGESTLSPVIEGVLREIGDERALYRKSLWITRSVFQGGGWKVGVHKARVKRDAVRISIGSTPWLDEWAQREDRGRQMFRHAIYLRQSRARLILVLAPAVREKREQVLEMFRDGVRRAIEGGVSA